MHAFVTGSTGLLGSNLVHLLVEQGWQVTALVRSSAKAARQFAGLAVNLVQGDMNDVDAFTPHLAGVDVLFHTAAYFREYYQPGDHWSILQKINIDGTIALLHAAERYNLKKVIYTSSAGVIGRQPGQTWGDESNGPDAELMANLYFKSKTIAEAKIAAFLKTSTLPVVLILPGWMFGPGDAAPTSAGQLILALLNGEQPLLIPGGGVPVDARDVAQGMINAVAHGRSGERYIISGETYYSFREMAALVEEISGVATPKTVLPYPFALTLAAILQTRSRLTGKPVLLTVNAVRTVRRHFFTRSTKAKAELGIAFRPFAVTLRDLIAWYVTQQPEQLKATKRINQALQQRAEVAAL